MGGHFPPESNDDSLSWLLYKSFFYAGTWLTVGLMDKQYYNVQTIPIPNLGPLKRKTNEWQRFRYEIQAKLLFKLGTITFKFSRLRKWTYWIAIWYVLRNSKMANSHIGKCQVSSFYSPVLFYFKFSSTLVSRTSN